MTYRRNHLIMLLLIPLLSACGKGLPEMEEVKSIITDGGISLSEPTGPMAGFIKSAQSAANLPRSAGKPQVEFLETEDKTLLTIYRFEDEEQAQKVEELLTKFKEMNKTPEAFEKLVRKQ